MLTRIEDFFTFFAINESERLFGRQEAARACEKTQGMMNIKDFEALAAIILNYRPRRIFEIGTYLGVTSDFFLSLLPNCEVVSIAYINSRWNVFGRRYNNSELPREKIGSEVQADRRARFTQLYGDSHQLTSESLVQAHGNFDLVLIDGDHSAKGVFQDTELAKKIITPAGLICWHDANPRQMYLEVRRFLENELSLSAIATKDDYVGGIAVWSSEIEERLKSHRVTSQ